MECQLNDNKNLGVDELVTDLSDDQFRSVLEQLTDNKLPDKDKCYLVRSLKQNAQNQLESKEESCLKLFHQSISSSTSSSSSFRSSGRKSRHFSQKGTLSKDAEFVKNRSSSSASNCSSTKKVHSSLSLQDLANCDSESSSISMRAIGAHRNNSKRLSKANSFTMSSNGSPSFCNNNTSMNNNNITSTYNSKEMDNMESNVSTNKQFNLKMQANRNKTSSIKTKSSSSSSSSPSQIDDCNMMNNLHVNDCDSKAKSLGVHSSKQVSCSSRNSNQCSCAPNFQQETNKNYTCKCDINQPTPRCNTAQQEESQDNQVIGIEMQELGKRVNIVEYNKQLNEARLNCNSVDTMLNVTALNNGLRGSGQERFINSNYDYNDYDKEDNKLVKANFGTYCSYYLVFYFNVALYV